MRLWWPCARFEQPRRGEAGTPGRWACIQDTVSFAAEASSETFSCVLGASGPNRENDRLRVCGDTLETVVL